LPAPAFSHQALASIRTVWQEHSASLVLGG
jgi:hypothetical protein